MPRILLVDDQPMVLEALRCMLEARGFGVLTARGGEAALQLFEAERPDATLVDVDMPEMNGIEVCRALRKLSQVIGHPLRVSLMTGVPRPELDAPARAAGARVVLAKPFTTPQLVDRILELITADSGPAGAGPATASS